MRCQPFRGKLHQEALYSNPSFIFQYSNGNDFVNYKNRQEKDNEKMEEEEDNGWLSKDIQNLNKQKTKTKNSSSRVIEKNFSPLRNFLLEKSKNFNEKIYKNNFDINEEEKDNDNETEPGEIPISDFEETTIKLNNNAEISFVENDGNDNIDKDIIWLIGRGERIENSKTIIENNKNVNNLFENGGIEENERMEEDNDWFSKDFQNKTQTLEDNLNSQIIEKHSKQINEKKNQKEIILLNDNEEELISNDGTEAADIFKKNENLIKENVFNFVENSQKENELMEFDDCWLSKNIQNQQKTNTIKESSVEKPLSPLKNLIKQKELKINEKIKEIGIEPVETLNLNNEENKDDDISTEPGEIPPSDCESSETEPGEIPPSENESFGTEPGELPLSDFEEEDEKVNNSLNQNWIIGKDERNEKINCCSDTVIVIRMGIL